jgi:hypothetical protein
MKRPTSKNLAVATSFFARGPLLLRNAPALTRSGHCRSSDLHGISSTDPFVNRSKVQHKKSRHPPCTPTLSLPAVPGSLWQLGGAVALGPANLTLGAK